MPSDPRREKWQERYREPELARPTAAGVLVDNAFLLPGTGRALDLACGRGGNALFLAGQGLQTEAWDYAEAAVEALNRRAAHEELPLQAVLRDVEQSPPAPDSFDVIVVSYFLARQIVPALIDALKPGGLLFYETFSLDAVTERGPRNREFRLGDNELLELFRGLRVLSYQEHGHLGDCDSGLRDVARMVACKMA